jgi:hypothetical protein
MWPMSGDLPALERLTADVIAAMQAAERRRRRSWYRGWPLAVAILAISVPSAVALRVVAGGDRVVDVPGMRHGHGATRPSGPTVVLARGAVNGHPYTFVAERCGQPPNLSIATGLAFGPDLARAGGGFDVCHAPARPQPALAVDWAWSPGQTWITGIVRGDARTVELWIVRQRQGAGGGLISSDATRLRVQARPIDPEAVRQGHLPTGWRYFLVYRPSRSALTRATALNADNNVIAHCDLRKPGCSQ